MGHGIAQVSATAGYNVVLRDIKQEFLDKAMEKIKWSLDKLVSKEKISKEEGDSIFSRITPIVDLNEAVKNAELVIEVVASEITLSPIHKAAKDKIRKDAGLALRFPKFTGKIRVEKAVEDASTNEEVISLYKGQNKSAHDKNLM